MDNYSQKKCGFCGENIPREATRCPFCGSILEVAVDEPYAMPEQQQGGTAGFDAGNAAGSIPGNGAGQTQVTEFLHPESDNQFAGSDKPAEGSNNPVAENQNNSFGQQYSQAPQQYNQAPQQYNPAPGQGIGQRPEYGQRQDYGQRPYYPRQQQQPPVYHNNGSKPPLSNGLKVFLTMLFTLLPGIGQLAGIITAIVFMSTDGDNDRRSFGVALLVATLAMFVLSCLGCFILYSIGENYPF